jgi:arabinan endo-1,5-alpha-L-arabinosidase
MISPGSFIRGKRRAFVLLAAVCGLCTAVGVTPSAAVTAPTPVSTHPTADPGVLLDDGTFYAFGTGNGLQESTATIAAGPWSTPTNVLNEASIPSWMDLGPGVWAPDMIKTASGTYVVYFASALPVPSTNPAGNDAKPAGGARCIGAATSTSPRGPFTVEPNPIVCLTGYGAGDDMTADPGNRILGEGVIDPSPAFVTVNGQQLLYLVYKTQAPSGNATIRMARLSDDGVTVLPDSHQLLASVDSTTIEGPSLVQNGSWFILFVAHGNFGTCGYSTEWFKSQHIWAWTSTAGTTLLSSANTGVCGPGGADVSASEVAGQYRLFLHGWVKTGTTTPATAAQANTSASTRDMYAAVLTFASDGFTPTASFLAP